MIIDKIFAKIDTNAPEFGDLFNFFNFTQTGYNWITRNRLKTIIRTTINAAIDQTKEEVAWYINKLWAFDTGQTADEATQYIRKRMYTDISKAFGLFIGADSYYMEYVLTMAKRMRARGKSVKWTNPATKQIEDDIIGNTVAYASQQLKKNLKEFLGSIELGWMFGKGRIPKQKVEIANKLLSPYRGTYKPMVWLQ